MRALLMVVLVVTGCSGTAPVAPVIVDAGPPDAGCGGYLQACCPGPVGVTRDRCEPDEDGGARFCCGTFPAHSGPGKCLNMQPTGCSPPAD